MGFGSSLDQVLVKFESQSAFVTIVADRRPHNFTTELRGILYSLFYRFE